MIAAINALMFAALLVAVPSCAFLGLYLMWLAFFRPLAGELRRDSEVEYSYPVSEVPSRPAPQWLLVASGKAVLRV